MKIENEEVKELSFKERFLKAPIYYYTINIGSFSNINLANKFIKNNKLKEKVFLVYTSKKYIKIMYGIYPNKIETKKNFSKLSKLIKSNNPFIQRIYRAQVLYKKTNLTGFSK